MAVADRVEGDRRCRGRRRRWRSGSSAEHRRVRDDEAESVASQATSPSTLATARPRPNRLPSFSIVTSRRRTSPGTTTRLKRHSSIPANRPIRSPKPGLLRDVDGHRLGERLDLEDAGHDRQAREVALEEPLGRGHALDADDPLRLRVVLDDPVDEQERPAVRDQRLDLAGRVDDARRGGRAAVVATSVTGGSGWGGRQRVGTGRRGRARSDALGSGPRAWSVQVCTTGRARLTPGRRASPPLRAARNAALPTRSSRFVVIRPSRKARWRAAPGGSARS